MNSNSNSKILPTVNNRKPVNKKRTGILKRAQNQLLPDGPMAPSLVFDRTAGGGSNLGNSGVLNKSGALQQRDSFISIKDGSLGICSINNFMPKSSKCITRSGLLMPTLALGGVNNLTVGGNNPVNQGSKRDSLKAFSGVGIDGNNYGKKVSTRDILEQSVTKNQFGGSFFSNPAEKDSEQSPSLSPVVKANLNTNRSPRMGGKDLINPIPMDAHSMLPTHPSPLQVDKGKLNRTLSVIEDQFKGRLQQIIQSKHQVARQKGIGAKSGKLKKQQKSNNDLSQKMNSYFTNRKSINKASGNLFKSDVIDRDSIINSQKELPVGKNPDGISENVNLQKVKRLTVENKRNNFKNDVQTVFNLGSDYEPEAKQGIQN